MPNAKVQCQCSVPVQEVLCPLCNEVERKGVDVESVDACVYQAGDQSLLSVTDLQLKFTF